MELVAGVDSSTQSTKVVLRDVESGQLVAQASAPHPATNPPKSEQDPRSWWQALVEAFQQLSPHLPSVQALSVGGQQHGLVLLDSDGQPVRPAKLWNDTTSSLQAERLTSKLGAEYWADRCGSALVGAFTITKLAWVIENEPANANNTAKVMLPHDYLNWRLTGNHVTDRGDASGTGWFDPAAEMYRTDLLDQVAPGQADRWIDRLPRVLRSNEPAGHLTPDAATALGLPTAIPVGPGTGDNMAAALGLGLGPGDVAISLGTSGTVYSTSLNPTHDPTGIIAGFADATNNFLPLICTLNATKVTNAVADWFATTPSGLGSLAGEAVHTNGEAMPILIPYFDGERTPNLPNSAGQWFGLRPTTTKQELALSAFDGVLCNLLDGFDAFAKANIATPGRTFLIGGGAQSPIYRQRAVLLSGRSIIAPDDDQLVATGAASQAAAILTNSTADTIATRWNLGTGQEVSPTQDPSAGSALRQRYREAASRVGHQHQ